jgi:hypothetical protein
MEEERFEELAEIIEQRHRDKTENWVLAEARRAREENEQRGRDTLAASLRLDEVNRRADETLRTLTAIQADLKKVSEGVAAKDAEIEVLKKQYDWLETDADRFMRRANHAELVADEYKAACEKAETLVREGQAAMLKEGIRTGEIEAENTRLREALDDWGQHLSVCVWGIDRDSGIDPRNWRPCDCGLEAVLGRAE